MKQLIIYFDSISVVKKAAGFPLYLMNNTIKILDKGAMLNCFNKHFVAVGSSFKVPKTIDMNRVAICAVHTGHVLARILILPIAYC